jgi:hypothetical protein
MSDPDQPGEELDEAVGDEEYPPTRPWAAADLGTTAVEEIGGESFEEREARTEPEVWERLSTEGAPEPGIELLGDDAGVPDDEDELVAELAEDDDDADAAAWPSPAEEAALHLDVDEDDEA